MLVVKHIKQSCKMKLGYDCLLLLICISQSLNFEQILHSILRFWQFVSLLISLFTLYFCSEKKRKPAWTDRILWKVKNLSEVASKEGEFPEEENLISVTLNNYVSHMSYGISDHKPVTGTFKLEVLSQLCCSEKVCFTQCCLTAADFLNHNLFHSDHSEGSKLLSGYFQSVKESHRWQLWQRIT